MSFDDLAYPNFGSSSESIVKYCRSCEESREVRLEDWECRTCGERLERLQPGMGAGTGTGDEPHGNGNLMMQQLFHQVAASAATAGGEPSDLPSNDLASQLQSLFIPSLNSTYMDMVQAQQGISLDVLMERLLHEDSLKSSPCSKKFLESLIQSERPLESRDFIQIVVRVGGVERDIFPTIGKFGSGEKYVETHAKKIAEEQEEKKSEKKKRMESKQSTSTTTSSSSSSSPSSTTTTDSSATELSASSSSSSSASSTSAPDTVTAVAADADDDDDDDDNSLHDSPPISHVSSTLVQSNPITGAPRPLNSRLFVGKWVLMLRGGITFLDKARFTQDAMGGGLIVIQTESNEKGWPFVITDSTGKSGDIIIPVLMVSKTDGEMIQDVVNKKKAANDEAPTTINVNTRIRPLACSICRDDYVIGSRCVTLPCHHSYCLSCITPWLEKRHLCPMCRYALPTDAKKSKEDLLGPESNHAQLQRDMFT